jgi:arsenite transporter
MMYPILCKVRYETLHLLLQNRDIWIQIAVSFILNWIIAPLFMVALAWSFLPDRPELREGLIFVGIARCIAMVLIWNDLAKGDGDYCAVLVAFNSILQIILFAPFAVFYIKIVSHSQNELAVNYSRVATSVAVFLGKVLKAISFYTDYTRNPFGGSHSYQTHITSTPWPRKVSKTIPPLRRTLVFNWIALHNHRAFWFSGSTCRKSNHICPTCLRTTFSVLFYNLHIHNLAMQETRIWL